MKKRTTLLLPLILISSLLIGLNFTTIQTGAGAPAIQNKNSHRKDDDKEEKKEEKKAVATNVKGGDRILAVLDKQVAAWNAGDLEKFMVGYWRSPELTFYSSNGKVNGWEATLERYRKTYQAEGREMGKLVFDDLDITMLGPDSALVRGRWKLAFSDGKQIGGIFTLVFRQLRNEWKIVHDHTSST
ncbi:MAG: nuclear transport factor 2 family protein [Acidobacteria bacterium]|nr:nuclear transport factor 2 family protein [Acidobacteriota bacterium]